MFQSFDHEKYKFIQIPELQNNNHPRANRTSNKTSLSLAGLRIDERGGIYLNPLLDSNSAYFKCYVAEEVHSGDLIGYILFFNTLDDTRTVNSGHDDPVAVIEDLYVKPKYRNRGIATQLWRKVLKVSCLLCPPPEDRVKLPAEAHCYSFVTFMNFMDFIQELFCRQMFFEN